MVLPRGRALNRFLLLVNCGWILLAVACGQSGNAPPRSPLSDSSSGVGGRLPDPSPASVSLGRKDIVPRFHNTSPTEDLEASVAHAIDLLSEWLGISPTQISVLSAEAVIWTNACLGIRRPGVVCEEERESGVRVVLIDGFGGEHAVHLDLDGHGVWVGQDMVLGHVISTDVRTGRLILDVGSEPLLFRVVPGTLWQGAHDSYGFGTLTAGDAVLVAYDSSPDGSEPFVVTWGSLEEPSE